MKPVKIKKSDFKSIIGEKAYGSIKALEKGFRKSRYGGVISGRKIRKSIKHSIHKYEFHKRLDKAIPVFVFQMGKVGSSSIFYSLLKQYPGAVVHGHEFINRGNWRGEYLVDMAKKNKPIKLISPIREPIGRNVSAFFHFIKGANEDSLDKSNLSVNELRELFLNNPDQKEIGENQAFLDHEFPLKWFDENIKKYFGIDVYAIPYSDSGINRYSSGNIELLVLRIDLDDSTKEKAIREFLGFPDFVLENTNRSSDKEYSTKYNEFKKNVKLPESYISEMYDSKYFKHFFTENDKASLIKKWQEEPV
jgi:hypothetical protein